MTRVHWKESYKVEKLQRDDSKALQSVPLEYSAEILVSASVWGNYPRPKEPLKWIRSNRASYPHRAENSTYSHHPKPPTKGKPHDSWRT